MPVGTAGGSKLREAWPHLKRLKTPAWQGYGRGIIRGRPPLVGRPGRQDLEILQREGGSWVVVATHGGEVSVRAEPFDVVELDLGRWWLP